MNIYPRTYVPGAGLAAVNGAISIGYFLTGGPGGSEIMPQNQASVKRCGDNWPIDFIEAFSLFPAPFPRHREYGQETQKRPRPGRTGAGADMSGPGATPARLHFSLLRFAMGIQPHSATRSHRQHRQR